MSTALVFAGQETGLINLVDILREEHEELQRNRTIQIEARKEARIPLDDNTIWSDVDKEVESLKSNALKRSTVLVSQSARKIFDLTNGNALEPIPDFVEPENLKGIQIRLRIPSNSQYRRWVTVVQDAWSRKRDALISGNIEAQLTASDDIDNGISETVLGSIVEIKGIEGLTIDNLKQSIDALDSEGILSALYSACRHFAGLPRKKALLCGVQQPST